MRLVSFVWWIMAASAVTPLPPMQLFSSLSSLRARGRVETVGEQWCQRALTQKQTLWTRLRTLPRERALGAAAYSLTYSPTTVRQWESRLSSLAKGLVPGTHLRSSREVAAGSMRMSSPISRAKLCIW